MYNKSWYRTLKRSSLSPPDYVFGIVCDTLFNDVCFIIFNNYKQEM